MQQFNVIMGIQFILLYLNLWLTVVLLIHYTGYPF